MIDVSVLIKEPLETRQAHLKLSESCIERGGNSTNHKGVLAQYLGTTIPSGRILCCHACNNSKCSHPLHLYWGTDYENLVLDKKKFGEYKDTFQRTVEKYGYVEACKMNAKRGSKRGLA